MILRHLSLRKIVDALKHVPHNPAYDSFLWGKGFKDVDMDYLGLYKKDAEAFIEYFTGKSPEEKKILLEDVFDSDTVNEEVIAWLDENEPELIREVGLNG